MTIEMNIGESAIYSQDEVNSLLAFQCMDFELSLTHKLKGIYNNKVEETLYVKGEYNGCLSQAIDFIEWLCEELEQECISIKTEMGDIMVYDPSYIGKKIKFDEEYFKTPSYEV